MNNRINFLAKIPIRC